MSLRTTVRDRLAFSAPEAAASGAIQVINALQDLHPASQVIALATAFKLTSDVLSLEPRDLLHTVQRMEDDCRYEQVNTLNAVRAYIDGELRKNP